MMLRHVGLDRSCRTVLMASSGAFAGPALVFEPITARCSMPKIPTPSGSRIPHQVDDGLCRLQALKAGTVTP